MNRFVEISTIALELLGVSAIIIGVLIASICFAKRFGGARLDDSYRRFRADIGRGILIGLELLIAADILRSLVISPKLESIGVLAGIVFVRTFLSFSLQVEIDGHWPWSRTALTSSYKNNDSTFSSGNEGGYANAGEGCHDNDPNHSPTRHKCAGCGQAIA